MEGRSKEKLDSGLELLDADIFAVTDTELLQAGADTAVGQLKERDLLGEDFAKPQFSKSEDSAVPSYGPWSSEDHNNLLETMELFRPPDEQKASEGEDWAKLSESTLLLSGDPQASTLGTSGSMASIGTATTPSPVAAIKSSLAQASQTLPFPSSRTAPQALVPQSISPLANKDLNQKRKATAIGGTTRPKKKTKREPGGKGPAQLNELGGPLLAGNGTNSAIASPVLTSTISTSSPMTAISTTPFPLPPSTASTLSISTSSASSTASVKSPLIHSAGKPSPMIAGVSSVAATPNVVQPIPPSLPTSQILPSISLPPSTSNSTTDKCLAEKDAMTETSANQLLDENLHVIGVMRENLVNGKVAQNFELMMRFSNNINSVLKWLQSLSGVQMPPLPVKLNTYFFPTAAPHLPSSPMNPSPPATTTTISTATTASLSSTTTTNPQFSSSGQ